jgi:DNA-binding PadR family transcriptional regulator
MSQLSPRRRNLWSLTVLCLLRLRPMHPYEMQRLIREWHKDDFLDLKRGSLYHAIEQLRRAGWIEPVETSREGRRPERTVYRLTEDGQREVIQWLGQLLARPLREPTQFFAALSFLPHLSPANVAQQLQERVGLLEGEVAGLTAVLETMVPKIGRLVLVEVEYARAMRQAELAWVKSLLEDLRTGRLTWDPEAVCQAAANMPPPGKDWPE